MRKLVVILFLLTCKSVCGQDGIIKPKDISTLDSVIYSLEKEYENSIVPDYFSLPQTTSDYFEIKTSDLDGFSEVFKKANSIEELMAAYPQLIVDRSLLIIKSQYIDYKDNEVIAIKTFEIKNNRNHEIVIPYSDSLEKQLKFFEFYKSYKSDLYTISGFFLEDYFQSYKIPEKYADWLFYGDVLIQPEEKIFIVENKSMPDFTTTEETIIDSLVSYFDLKSGKPFYPKDPNNLNHYRDSLEMWRTKRKSDLSKIYEEDATFKILLDSALTFAEKSQVTNGDLEDFTAHLLSKERALNLMRLNQQVGSCSFDNGPLEQQKRIARLAAETHDWSIFIKAFLNVMNDQVSRVADNSIASEARSTYVQELKKLDLDMYKILLGANLKVKNGDQAHYFADGSKIAQAFANLEENDQEYFENTLVRIIQDNSVDDFNKLHHYNTFLNYQYFQNKTDDSLRIADKINSLTPYLPFTIKSRIENPNKQLSELLHREAKTLEKFEILDSDIGNILSYSYSGDCWMADMVEKGNESNIVYNLTMPITDEITPFNNFTTHMSELKRRIENHDFIQQIANQNLSNRIYINFTDDRSFANFKDRVLEKIPEKIKESESFENALSFYITFSNRRYVRFILLENNAVLVLGIPEGFTLPGYDFDELVTATSEGFLHKSYDSYKLFNEKGKMLN
ncbi:hypothetical protein SAMN04489724_2072 [Algoriphagus locisalis]|uniref:Uncharacterized protein n=1 Tax=Algoriphagus locisalis TaxID=305507 RepID=A0A1I7AM93_9BACT|nr:hypothetical protein [Algoriphagus locisalis]SFT76081.1 hypothetical protein SAMN04489724_2072 [Algoriphagus locisalis]